MNIQDLKQISVLQGLADDVLTRLADVLEEMQFEDGTSIFSEGDPGESMYFILEGVIRVAKAADSAGSTMKTLSLLTAGDYLGEMSLFDRRPRSASAVAAGKVRVLRLSGQAFDLLLRESSAVAASVLFGMIRTSSQRIRRLDAAVVAYDEIGKAVGESEDLQQLLEVVLRQVCRAIQADWGLLALKPQFSDVLEVRVAENASLTPEQKKDLGEARGLAGLAARDRKEILVRDLREEEPYRSAAVVGFESPAMLLVPVLVRQECLGLLILGHKTPAQFDLNDLNLVKGVAAQTAQAILNARHREEEASRAKLGRRFVRF